MVMPAARVNVEVIILCIIYRRASISIVCAVWLPPIHPVVVHLPPLPVHDDVLFVSMWEPVGEYVLLFTIETIFECDPFFGMYTPFDHRDLSNIHVD